MTRPRTRSYRVAVGRAGTLAGGRPLVAGDVIELENDEQVDANQDLIDAGILLEHVESKPETKAQREAPTPDAPDEEATA